MKKNSTVSKTLLYLFIIVLLGFVEYFCIAGFLGSSFAYGLIGAFGGETSGAPYFLLIIVFISFIVQICLFREIGIATKKDKTNTKKEDESTKMLRILITSILIIIIIVLFTVILFELHILPFRR